MKKELTWKVSVQAALVVLCMVTAAAAQDKVTIKGLIVARDGANMVVKNDTGNTTVALDDDTKVEAVKGKFGLRSDTLAITDLIPGIPVEVKGTLSDGKVTAREVKFKADDLKTAQQIQAGLNPTEQQLQSTQKQVATNQDNIDANRQNIQTNEQNIHNVQGEQAALSKRFGELGEYDVKDQMTAYFAVNSSVLSEDEKQQLQSLAANATKLNGYMIQVAGYTDSSGSAEHNQELSDRRAEAVISYLQQQCKVPLYRVLAPAAMGESDPVGSNETAQGKSENRRVEVKVLVNRGTNSSSS
jgi:outer membrane protein OmpA-like peptidoglycan-associated protein